MSFLKKLNYNNLSTELKWKGLVAIVGCLKDSRKACFEKNNKLQEMVKLGIVGNAFNESYSSMKRSSNIAPEDLNSQKELVDWVDKTVRRWKKKQFEEIDFEFWDSVIEYFENEALQLQKRLLTT